MARPRSGYIGKIPLHRTVLKTAERCAERVCGAKPVSKFTICINLFLNLRKKIQLECSCSHKAIAGYIAARLAKAPFYRDLACSGARSLSKTLKLQCTSEINLTVLVTPRTPSIDNHPRSLLSNKYSTPDYLCPLGRP